MEEIFIILLLILLNVVFSMSEIAIISARKSSLQADANKGSKAARTALNLAQDPDRFLSAVQVGITLIGILTGIFSGNKIAAEFSAVLQKAGMTVAAASALAQTIIVILVMFLTLIFGELVPKRIAMSASERVSKIVAGPMKFISMIAAPFVWLLAKTTSLVTKMLGIRYQETKVTEEEIKSIIQEGTDEGEVSPVEQDLVERVFALGDLKVSTIMTHRADIVWLDLEMTDQEIRETIESNIFEEYPVVEDDLDHVVGVLSLKEYVDAMAEGQEKIYFVPGENKDRLAKLPQVETLSKKGYDVLLFTEDVDEFIPQTLMTYQEKKFCNASSEDLGLQTEEEKKQAEEKAEQMKGMLTFVKESLGEQVKEVRLSADLGSAPACMVPDAGMSFEMEKYMKRVNPEFAFPVGRILELNADHPAVQAMQKAMTEDPLKAKDYALLLMYQAQLMAELPLEDPFAYTELVCKLMQ